MTFNEHDVNRERDGKFAAKQGSMSDVSLRRPQNISDIPQREPFTLYPGVETDLDNGGIIEWMDENGVEATAIYTGQRYADDGNGRLEHRYSVTLRRDNGETMTTPFSTGTGWTTVPSAGVIVDSLVSDAQFHRTEGRRGFVSMLTENGTSKSAADYEYTKFIHSVRRFEKFAGDGYQRLVDQELEE